MARTYDPNSLVDTLDQKGLDSSLTGRANLAVSKGLVSNANEYLTLASQGKNADINTKLLGFVNTPADPNGPTPAPAPDQNSSSTPVKGTVGGTPMVQGGPITSGDLGKSFGLPEPTTFSDNTKAPSLNDRITEVATANLTDSNQKAIENLKSQQQSLVTTAKDNAGAEVQKRKNQLANLVGGTVTQDAIKSVYDEYKIKENLQLYSDIQTKIVDAQNALQMGLIYEKDRPARMRFVTGAENTLQKQGLATIGALQGTAAVIKGNIDLAKSFADSTIDAINADNERSFTALTTLLDMANNEYVDLTTEERKLINDRISTIEDEATRLQKNKDDVLGYMTQYPKAFLNGGVTLLDTKEQALQKMLPYLAADEKAKFEADLYTKYKTSGASTDKAAEQEYKGQLLQGKNAGMSYNEAVLAFGDVLDINYINSVYGQDKTNPTGADAITQAYYNQFLNPDGTVKPGYKVTVDPKNGRPVVTQDKSANTGDGFWKNIGQAFGSLFK